MVGQCHQLQCHPSVTRILLVSDRIEGRKMLTSAPEKPVKEANVVIAY